MKNKKGQEESGTHVPFGLIILLVATLLLIYLVYKETKLASDVGETTACYTSIIGSMFKTEEATNQCPVTDIKIFNDKVEETKKGKTKKSEIVTDFSTTDRNVNELFAKLMGQCHQMGGGAYSKAFSRTWFTSTRKCLECFNVEFDKSVSADFFTGLREYLEENKVAGMDKKYDENLTKNAAHKQDWINYGIEQNIIPGKYEQQIKKDEKYTIFFIGIKQGTAEAATKWNFLYREDTYYVYVAPQYKFTNQICEKVAN